jgi:hypothetical protein
MRGWHYEGWRHSLAAKGISSSRKSYAIFKKSENVKPFDDFKDPEKRTDLGERRRYAIIDNLRRDLENKERIMINKKELLFEDSQRFFVEQFAPLEKQFMSGKISEDQLKDEAERSWDYFASRHQKTLKPFGWMKEEEDMKKGSKEPGLFDFEGKAKKSMAGIIPGGVAEGKSFSDFDQTQLRKGQIVEMEHTDDPAIALEISADHLAENPNYYGYLERMEKVMESKGHPGNLRIKQFARQVAPGKYALVKAAFDDKGDIVRVEMEDLL